MTDGWYFASLLGWALAWMALVRPLRLGQALLCAVCGMLLTAYLGVIVLPLRQVTAYFLMAGGLAALAAGLVLPILPYLLSFAAGAMIYVVVEELIPEMSEAPHSNVGTIFFAVGFALMMTLDVALG